MNSRLVENEAHIPKQFFNPPPRPAPQSFHCKAPLLGIVSEKYISETMGTHSEQSAQGNLGARIPQPTVFYPVGSLHGICILRPVSLGTFNVVL